MTRIPRNFDGIYSPNQKLSDLLPQFMAKIDQRLEIGVDEIFRAWKTLMGPTREALTEPTSFLDGVLTVEVKSATLYSCLCQYERSRLLRSLQEMCPRVGLRNLWFRRR